VIIPNGQLAQASIRNFTKPDPWSRRSLFIMAPYAVPPQRVQTIILDAIRGSFGVLEHPTPSVVTNDFKDRGIEYWVRFFTSDFDKRDRVDGMARDRIWYALARHGIEIPVATHSVRLTPMPAPREEAVEDIVEQRVARLRTIGLLSVFDESELQRVAREGAERLYAIGEPIVRQGASGESMFVLLHGHVEVTARKDSGPSTRFATLNSGDYFGEMSLMTGAPRAATVTALEETRVLEISKESFGRIMALRPELVVTLGNALQGRMAERDVALANARREATESGDLFRRIRQFFAL
jgi:CRP-like cAMP-binding protein